MREQMHSCLLTLETSKCFREFADYDVSLPVNSDNDKYSVVLSPLFEEYKTRQIQSVAKAITNLISGAKSIFYHKEDLSFYTFTLRVLNSISAISSQETLCELQNHLEKHYEHYALTINADLTAFYPLANTLHQFAKGSDARITRALITTATTRLERDRFKLLLRIFDSFTAITATSSVFYKEPSDAARARWLIEQNASDDLNTAPTYLSKRNLENGASLFLIGNFSVSNFTGTIFNTNDKIRHNKIDTTTPEKPIHLLENISIKR